MDKPATLPFEKTSVGTSPWRVDGIGLVTGSAKFTDDITWNVTSFSEGDCKGGR